LLNASLLPQLETDGLDVLAVGRVLEGWRLPRAALPTHNPYVFSILSSWSPGETASTLVNCTLQEFLSRRSERYNKTVYAAIDQAEELFGSSDVRRRAHARECFAQLAEALNESRSSSAFHLLVSVRESSVESVIAELGNGARYCLRSFDYQHALSAVTRPLGGTGKSYAEGTADKLVRDMMTGAIATSNGQDRTVDLDRVEPVVLQVTCSQLWESLPVDLRAITERDIHRYGDVDKLMATHCSRVIASVAAGYDLTPAYLHAWLVRTFLTEMGTRGTACEGLVDTAGMPNPVLRELEDRHLLVSGRRSGATWYQLLSDRLIGPLQRVGDLQPQSIEPEAYSEYAGRALGLGELAIAQRWAEHAWKVIPDKDRREKAALKSLLGNLAFERDRLSEAEDHYRLAANLFETVRDTASVAGQLAAVGQILLIKGQLSDAVEVLRAASDRIPNDLTVQTELGRALWLMGQCRAAVAVATGVLAIDGGDSAALRLRGEVLADLGEFRDALRDLDRVVRQEWPSTRAARGLARAELGDPDADEDIEVALEDSPRNGAVLLYAARAKARAGDRSAAMALARHALDATDPELPQHQRGAALELMGLASSDNR